MKDEKIIVEGAAAVAIASFIKMRKDIRDLKNIVIIVCGGNIGKDTLKSVLWIKKSTQKRKLLMLLRALI